MSKVQGACIKVEGACAKVEGTCMKVEGTFMKVEGIEGGGQVSKIPEYFNIQRLKNSFSSHDFLTKCFL